MIEVMKSVGLFFKYSPKRQCCFETAVQDAGNTDNSKLKIKPVCETRWVGKHKSFDDFQEL